jgi:transcriptional regulator with XRE-family HTH domain
MASTGYRVRARCQGRWQRAGIVGFGLRLRVAGWLARCHEWRQIVIDSDNYSSYTIVARAGGAAAMDGIGARVREARERRGMSMADLARAAGLSPGAVSRIEHGERSPGAETVSRLARALGVEAGNLMGSGDGGERAAAAPSSGLQPEVAEAISTVATIMPTLPLQGRQRVLRVLRAILDSGQTVVV